MNKYPIIAALAAGCVSAQTLLIRSTDGGRTWKGIDPGPPHRELLDLQISTDGSRLYALTVTRTEASQFDMRRDFAVLTSPDRGTSWQVLDALAVSNGFAAMAVAPSDATTVYLSRGEASSWGGAGAVITLVRTTDAGATTRESKGIAAALLPYNTQPAWCGPEPAFFGVHPANPANLFMCAYKKPKIRTGSASVTCHSVRSRGGSQSAVASSIAPTHPTCFGGSSWALAALLASDRRC